jgi:hypothetical protein
MLTVSVPTTWEEHAGIHLGRARPEAPRAAGTTGGQPTTQARAGVGGAPTLWSFMGTLAPWPPTMTAPR